MNRVFPNGIPTHFVDIAREWLEFKYGIQLEDYEVLEYLKNEVITQLGSCLEPLLLDKDNLTYEYTRYLMLSDFYNSVVKEFKWPN